MSTVSYLLLFLWISLHACYARHLVPLNKKLEEKLHFPVKTHEKDVFDSSAKQLNKEGQTKLFDDSEKPRNGRSTKERVKKANIGIKASGATSEKSLVTVSWHVPHNNKKLRHKHPRFDLDYSPPKTHPPHHN